jgi:hypothetical protein
VVDLTTCHVLCLECTRSFFYGLTTTMITFTHFDVIVTAFGTES